MNQARKVETIRIGHDRWYASQCGQHIDIYERPTHNRIRTICIHARHWHWSIAQDGLGLVITTLDAKVGA